MSDVKGDVHGPSMYGVGIIASGGTWSIGSKAGSRCALTSAWPYYVHPMCGAWAVAAAK